MPHQSTFEVATGGRGMLEITYKVAAIVAGSQVQCGLAHVFVQHTSCSLTITENADRDVQRDLETIIARLAPDGDPGYRHDAEGPDDMAAHARSVVTDAGLTIPVAASRLLLGTWQGIFLWEHRTTPHHRRIVVTVLGA